MGRYPSLICCRKTVIYIYGRMAKIKTINKFIVHLFGKNFKLVHYSYKLVISTLHLYSSSH